MLSPIKWPGRITHPGGSQYFGPGTKFPRPIPLAKREIVLVFQPLDKAGAGAQWDPQVVDNFMACRSEVYHIGRHETDGSLSNIVGEVVQSWSLDSSGKRPGLKGDGKRVS